MTRKESKLSNGSRRVTETVHSSTIFGNPKVTSTDTDYAPSGRKVAEVFTNENGDQFRTDSGGTPVEKIGNDGRNK